MTRIVLFILLLTTKIYANELQILINPKEPVVGKSFNIEFKVTTQEGTDPIINFNPGAGLEVIGREETGVTTSASYLNGQLSIERSISVLYELIATKPGLKFIRDINVEINGKRLRHSNIKVNVLKEPKKPRSILAVALVDKEEAFVGESILVRYYLYSKVPVKIPDIKKYPKLDKFLKRYHQEKRGPERVQYEGEIYTRQIMYTAQLFANNEGDYKIDPITLGVEYYRGGQNLYGNLGFGLGRTFSTTISSKPIVIKIKKLPSENMPKSFTGLVGKHQFNIVQNKNKFLINDPIEIKVVAKGEGALELFEVPTLIKNNSVEDFDSNADLVINNDFTATKTFNVTLLGRAALQLPEIKVPLSYFDTEKMQYETTYLTINPIKIAGSTQYVPSKGNEPEKVNDNLIAEDKKTLPPTYLKPIYTFANSYIYSSKYINMLLGIILLSFITWWGYGRYQFFKNSEVELMRKIKSEGVTFASLYNLIKPLGHGQDLREIVDKSNLNEDTKLYFINLIDKCESSYAQEGKTKKFKVKKRYLNEIRKIIEDKNDCMS